MSGKTRQKGIVILIVVLAVMLALTGTALAGTVIYKNSVQPEVTPAVSDNNVITTEKMTAKVGASSESNKSSEGTVVQQAESEETVLKLYRRHATDSVPFQLSNMFPGDVENHAYIVQVSYKGTLTLNFHADVRQGYEKLAEVLKCTVSLRDGDQLYDGLMRDMPEALQHQLPQSEGGTAELIYDIKVYLDTSVGNEYMNKELFADFNWWVDVDESAEQPSSGDPADKPSDTAPGQNGGGQLIAPQTGDSNTIWIGAGIVAGIALLLALWLLFGGRRKKEGRCDE